MRVVFMGTPDFSVPTLESIIEAGHEVVGVVTQPDKAKGRGKKVPFPPVKEKALEHDLTVYQPRRAREPEFIEQMRALEPDVMVVVAFGQILPKDLLDIPKYGCVNVHASLASEISGSGADPVGGHPRGKSQRCDDDADGCGTGHRRYAS